MRILLLVLICSAFAKAQKLQAVVPDLIGKTLEEVCSIKEWQVVELKAGDLDRDGDVDYVVVLQERHPDDPDLESMRNHKFSLRRIICVAVSQSEVAKVSVQNNDFILKSDDGGMLGYIAPEISIDSSGLLKIYYQFTRGNAWYVFKFKNNCFHLIYAESGGVHNALGDYENKFVDFRTMVAGMETGNSSEDDFKRELFTIQEGSAKCLSELGEAFSWEVIPDFHF
jgi:hypothetical protein